MAITKSAEKAIRQSLTRKVKNLRKKNKMKSLLKQVKNLVSQKKFEEAKKLLPLVYKALGKAVKTGLVKKNTAARTKSRIAKAIVSHH